MTTFLENTNIADLLQVSSGNFAVLEKMTEEFRQRVQQASQRITSPDNKSSGTLPIK